MTKPEAYRVQLARALFRASLGTLRMCLGRSQHWQCYSLHVHNRGPGEHRTRGVSTKSTIFIWLMLFFDVFCSFYAMSLPKNQDDTDLSTSPLKWLPRLVVMDPSLD